MSLSTTDALNNAIADLVNAKLCLLDATEANVREELEQIESITHYLEDKLVKIRGRRTTYRIVAYGPGKECLTWVASKTNLEAWKQYLRLEGYTDFRIEKEKE